MNRTKGARNSLLNRPRTLQTGLVNFTLHKYSHTKPYFFCSASKNYSSTYSAKKNQTNMFTRAYKGNVIKITYIIYVNFHIIYRIRDKIVLWKNLQEKFCNLCGNCLILGWYLYPLAFFVLLNSYLRRHPTKLWRIIRLRKIIQKYSLFLSVFGTWIRSKQASLLVLHTKRISLLKLNSV